MARRSLSILTYLALALYLTPASSGHFCHFFSHEGGHGNCESHPIPFSGEIDEPHEEDCFEFQKDVTQSLTNSFTAPPQGPEVPLPERPVDSFQRIEREQVELRMPERSDTTDPPDLASDPTRGPPFLIS